jgi:carbon storage regulator
MLVLTRKPQEKIQIGDGITITVIRTKGTGVRLGIEAPADVPVLRGELVAARSGFAELNAAEKPAEAKASERGVQFTRTTRSRVATVLPSLLGEPGPLRAMMRG